jgi:hypothetical protein
MLEIRYWCPACETAFPEAAHWGDWITPYLCKPCWEAKGWPPSVITERRDDRGEEALGSARNEPKDLVPQTN